MVQKHLSVPGTEAPSAQTASLQHYLEIDGGTAEECEDIVATGHIHCIWYAIQVDKPRCVRLSRLQASFDEIHTSGDRCAIMPQFSSPKYRSYCSIVVFEFYMISCLQSKIQYSMHQRMK